MKLHQLASAAIAVLALSTTHLATAADDHKGHSHDDKKGSEHAHDAKPAYGGIVSVIKDVNYELVAKPDTITLYVTDHGKPVDTKNASATLTLLSAADKSEVKLVPAGGNKLEAKGNFKVEKGTKVVASVTSGGKPQSVRFTLN
ncbi:hypothetical protein RY831_04705 [Noviherbaspirillum sp. CPCC 100848]|uniref:DUF5666 domain-containing protein n=1 Tax=Noviherbaspirillum album TaxID=3080276 RepID=A0ABU6J471_9BURK|nr:hypothetical protein [Noviherbaspirillum sp. CPCC 100848]MEC4718434.1 hypothetical protein [Noviherbaspirillum sp. CPCC 100848]